MTSRVGTNRIVRIELTGRFEEMDAELLLGACVNHASVSNVKGKSVLRFGVYHFGRMEFVSLRPRSRFSFLKMVSVLQEVSRLLLGLNRGAPLNVIPVSDSAKERSLKHDFDIQVCCYTTILLKFVSVVC